MQCVPNKSDCWDVSSEKPQTKPMMLTLIWYGDDDYDDGDDNNDDADNDCRSNHNDYWWITVKNRTFTITALNNI